MTASSTSARVAQAERYRHSGINQDRGRAGRFLAQLAEYRLAKEITGDRFRL